MTTPKEIFDNSVDASFANNPDWRSGEGYVFKLYRGSIDWVSRKQSTVTTSTTEAELLAMLHAGKQAIWWNNLFRKLHFDPSHELSLKNDNQQTIRLLTAQMPVLTTKLRHVDISQHWLWERVQNGDIQVKWVNTNDMVADGFTKALPRQKQERFVKQLGLVDIGKQITGWGMDITESQLPAILGGCVGKWHNRKSVMPLIWGNCGLEVKRER